MCAYLQVPGDLPPHEGAVHLDPQQSPEDHLGRVDRGARTQLRSRRFY